MPVGSTLGARRFDMARPSVSDARMVKMPFLPPLTVARALKIAADFYGVQDLSEFPDWSFTRRDVKFLAGKILHRWSDMNCTQISLALGMSPNWLANRIRHQHRPWHKKPRLGEIGPSGAKGGKT